jgi:glycosyltransferase involved in cell wall biosynthesis
MRLFDIKSLGPVIYQTRHGDPARVVVVVPLYNYAATIDACLNSLIGQTLQQFSLVVIDDASTDDGADRAVEFLRRHPDRFSQGQVIRHRRNQGLSMTRNSGIAWSSEPFLFMLDADNALRPPALARLLEAVECSGAAFAYSQLRMFGDSTGVGVADIWDPDQLRIGNYIDAMAMIRRDALLAVNGYAVLADDHGWEDYDLWCSFAERGLRGVFLPEVLCDYRVHGASMLRSRTNQHYDALMAEMALRHPTLFAAPTPTPTDCAAPTASDARESPGSTVPTSPRTAGRSARSTG